MQTNKQIPYPANDLVQTRFGNVDARSARQARGKSVHGRQSRRDRFDYRLIFSVCFLVFLCAALIERCNPFGRGASRGEGKSIWQQSKGAAHLCTSITMQV